jgi:fatty-acyl-CoA synthase
LPGLMQDWPLTLDKILDHARAWHGESEIVSRTSQGTIVRSTYASAYLRAKRASNMLLSLGVRPGDRVATLAWNGVRHFEAWYGIMGIGAVCHTLNPRLFAEQLTYIINQAGDRIILVDADLVPIVAAIRDNIPCVEHVVVLTSEADMSAGCCGALCYEDLLCAVPEECTWGGFDEQTAAGLCFTSGTTGNPKGVLYSHRSNFLHTLASIAPDALNLSATDTILPIVPMFHANAWGLVFSAAAVGAKLVLPGNKLDGASIHELLETEGVTFSAAVPTVWQQLLDYLYATGRKLSSLQRVVIGGSCVPPHMVRSLRDDFGVDVLHAWGMTEISPVGTIASLNQRVVKMGAEAQAAARLKQGRAVLGIEMKLADDDGRAVPHDGSSYGRLMVRGPWVAREYLNSSAGALLDKEGFFDTGDVATIDECGYMQIVDRTKDIIKSGGEWISSVALETIMLGHPAVEGAVAIGVAHPRWGERPLLVIKLKGGQAVSKDELLRFLGERVAKWWVPDDVLFVQELPLGPTGKIDKKTLRRQVTGPA